MQTAISLSLEFKWSVSRGRDTAGYNICSLYVDGRKVASTCGGGYDMKGTVLGKYIAGAYADRLLALKESDMPEHHRWERSDKPRKLCDDAECTARVCLRMAEASEEEVDAAIYHPHEAEKCRHCGGELRNDHNDGKRVSEGRYLYGLRFVNPNYDPGKAVIGKDCSDRCLSKDSQKGKTVEQAERDGVSFGLERIQAAYRQTSAYSTELHTIPAIDGACGMESVQQIMKAIGLELQYLPGRRNRKNDLYLLHDKR